MLRLRERRPVNIKVINDAGYPDLIHWHGMDLPAHQEGAVEEGSPIIPVGNTLLCSFTPHPTGTRWYHSHAMAMTDLRRSTYSGEFGFLIVESATGEPGNYDREVLLAARRWEGMWVSMQDLREGPPPDNGLEVMYHAATLGHALALPAKIPLIVQSRALRERCQAHTVSAAEFADLLSMTP